MLLKRLGLLAIGALALGAVALPLQQAKAQMYLGWDFGNGFGVGIGTPPSAYYAPHSWYYGWPYPYVR